MSRSALTGSRIRERRSMMEMRQADLARHVGISASYLNLIEHNRRRIGGKLLMDIAAALQIEPAALSEGAEAHLSPACAKPQQMAASAPKSIVWTSLQAAFRGGPNWSWKSSAGSPRWNARSRF